MSRLAGPGEPREFSSLDLEMVLAEIREACYNHPQQRIAQVISNAVRNAGGPPDIFYIEDEKLLDALRDYKDSV